MILNKGTYLSCIIYPILENTTHISLPRTFAVIQTTTNTLLTFFLQSRKTASSRRDKIGQRGGGKERGESKDLRQRFSRSYVRWQIAFRAKTLFQVVKQSQAMKAVCTSADITPLRHTEAATGHRQPGYRGVCNAVAAARWRWRPHVQSAAAAVRGRSRSGDRGVEGALAVGAFGMARPLPIETCMLKC